MRTILFILPAAGLLLTACGGAELTVDRTADIAALTTAKLEAWPKFYRENDADGLEAFLADEFVLIGDDGSITPKAKELEWVRHNQWAGSDGGFVYTIDKILFPSDDTAIIYGIGRSTRENEAGAACQHSYSSSNSFKRENGRWRAIMSHVSGVKCVAETP